MKEETYRKTMDSLIAGIDSNTNDNILISLQIIFAKIGDSHTTISWEDRLQDNKLLPFLVESFSDGFYITKATKNYRYLLGKRIIAINHYPIDTVINSFKKLIVSDNDAFIKLELQKLFSYKALYQYFKFIKNTDTLSLSLQNDDNNTVTYNIIFNKKVKHLKPIKLKSIPLYLEKRNKLFWFESLPEDSILFIQYNQCLSKEVWKNYKQIFKPTIKKYYKFPINIISRLFLNMKIITTPSFNKFTNKVYRNICKNQYKKAVLDLRFNIGGSSTQGSIFIDSLSKISNFKLFGIIGKETFSSGIINAIDLKNHEAILVGENTSGMAQSYGEVRTFYTPNLYLEVSYSTKYFNLSDKYTNTITPDIECKLNFNYYIKGIDTCMNLIMKNH